MGTGGPRAHEKRHLRGRLMPRSMKPLSRLRARRGRAALTRICRLREVCVRRLRKLVCVVCAEWANLSERGTLRGRQTQYARIAIAEWSMALTNAVERRRSPENEPRHAVDCDDTKSPACAAAASPFPEFAAKKSRAETVRYLDGALAKASPRLTPRASAGNITPAEFGRGL
jgi:hypothetical protein